MISILIAASAALAPPMAPAPPPPRMQRESVIMEGEREPLRLVKAAVRAEAQRLYGRDCGAVTIPDRAFVPIEVSGASNPEYAVLLGRSSCAKWGGGSQRWSGTGGPVVQIWYASDGPARMVLERPMHAFSPTASGLTSLQHGGACPGGAGPNPCLVVYRWNTKDRDLEVAKRTFVDGARVKRAPRLKYEYEFLSR